ncbi:BTAD domain-containing putative transcriptional regulator [Spirillospora sp. NPDC029432]|uniref:BTAD domain-containing putative transcriptional regulator n=1 Tax=Spirillospora sp. NPDC029432 TaxID=3154599 RepID=UPI0034526B4C
MAEDAAAPRFEILGPLRAWCGGRELDLGPGKQRAVLAVLLLHANRPVSTTAIVDAVWGDEPPDNGANVVQKYVAGLRRVLEPDRSPRAPSALLALTPAGYVLHVPPDGLDSEVFQKRVRAALAVRSGGEPAEAAVRLREALALWREAPLAGLDGTVFDAARERLVEERAAALEACAEIELELGRHQRLVPELIRLVADFPLREGPRYLLILALYRCGRQAEALAAYRDARAFLAEEFGVEPGERLQGLHLAILRSDPGLLAWAPVDGSGAGSGQAAGTAAPEGPERYEALPGTGSAGPSPEPAGYGHGPPGHHGVHPRELRLPAPVRALLIATPLLTCGGLGWVAVAFCAAWRRSVLTALAAAGYLALTVFAWITLGSGDENVLRPIDDAAMIAGLLGAGGATVHLALLTSGPGTGRAPASPAPAVVDMIERRARREQARVLLLHHPAAAAELRVGRPDLPRTFDDGGLVDVNAVPEYVLAALPGLDPYHAKLIVAMRDAQGPYASIDDLIGRGVVPAHVLRALHEVLVAVPRPVDTPPPITEKAPGA